MEASAAFRDSDLTPGFRIQISLRLPRDRLSVPVVRHLVEYSLCEVGTYASDAQDVELALAEACTNVLTHAGPGDEYDVGIILGDEACTIRVVDVGRGFDATGPAMMAGIDAESGRGVGLMHAVMDDVRFVSEPGQGTVVELVKRLRFDDDAPARRLMLLGLSESDAPPGDATKR